MNALPASIASLASDPMLRLRTSGNFSVRAENAALALAFALAIVLPLTEIILRATLGIGIVGVTDIVQHLMLVVGMLGAAVATREERLLTLAVSTLIKGRAGQAARFINRVVAATVASMLMLTAMEFTVAEWQSGSTLIYQLPVWVAELPLPLGFALITLRLAGQAATNRFGRVAAALLVAALVVWLKLAPPASTLLATPALVTLLIATMLGAPIFVTIGGVALFLLMSNGVPLASLAVDHYSLVMNASLPSIPMFTLAGYLLAESSAPRRLIEVFDAVFGRLRGGAAIVTVLACTFFTSFTGASGVTVLALGGLVMPLLLANGFGQRSALGLVTAAGLPGTLLMPALPLILYAIVAGVSIGDMFLGGLLPSLMMATIATLWGMRQQPRLIGKRSALDWGRVRLAVIGAKWELAVPLVPMLALSTGIATPVESAALTTLYVFLITAIVHRDLSLHRDVPRVITECGLIIGGILLIMGVALGLTDCLVDAQVPDRVVQWVTASVGSRYGFLLVLNAFLLLAGCVIEIYPAILVLAPIVTHIGQAFDINPVHLGIIFLANMELGYLTPLVGLNLFFASYRFNKPVGEIFRAVLPLFLALGAGVLVITYLPWLSTAMLGPHH